MTVKFAPWGNSQFVDSTGAPAVGWKIETYVAGSSTPATTYTTSAGNVQQSNPIVLNALGLPTVGQIWLTEGVSYKLVLTNAAGTVQKTEDNISGVNDTSVAQDQWVSGPAPTYISATQFSLVGDQTSTFQVGRRVKTTNSGGTVYSRITVSAFGAETTVTVVNDSGTLDSGLSAVSYGLLSADNPSIPKYAAVVSSIATLTGTTGSIATATPTTIFAVSASAVGAFIVSAWSASGGGSIYTASATVTADGTGNARILSNDGAGLTITMSGANVQVTQSSGGNLTINWAYLLIM
jgi:hypothetical protein